MGCDGCRGFVAFVLKILNFVQAFIGAALILYSIWMLNHWKSRVSPPSPPPPPAAPSPGLAFMDNGAEVIGFGSDLVRLEKPLAISLAVTTSDNFRSRKLGETYVVLDSLDFHLGELPAPWFIYTCLAIGIIVCVVTCFGHIAAEITNGFCLCCYSVLIIMLILLEAALVGYIFFNHNWEKDFPDDPTGEFDNVKEFIKENINTCRWVGLSVVCIQAISLSLALILRAMVSTNRPAFDSDDEYNNPMRNSTHQPLLNQEGTQVSSSVAGESATSRMDAWTKRMREKYGLNPTEFAYGSASAKS